MIDFNRASRSSGLDRREIMRQYNEILPTLDLKALLEELGIEVDQSGVEWGGHCPLPSHGGIDSSGKFSINPDKALYQCWKPTCGGGNLLQLTQHMLDLEPEQALDTLRRHSDFGNDDKFAQSINAILDKDPESFPDRDPELPWFPMKVLDDLVYSEAVAERGISEETAALLHIGWRPNHYHKTHIGPALVIPNIWGGNLTGWQARWTTERPDWLQKYSNSDDFPKAHTIYALDQIDPDHGVILVESPLTAARLISLGHQAVATFGATISPTQMKILRQIPYLLLSLDNDDAGRAARTKLVDALDPFCELWIVPFVDGDKADLADLPDEDAINEHLDGVYAV